MRAFAHASPTNAEQVIQLLGEHAGKAALLAGGTDLLSLMKDEVVNPEVVVSLRKVEGLAGISRQDGAIRIGAMTTLEQLLADERLGSDYPGLVQAARGIHGPQIRSQGTVGGELCQRPRCWYFRGGHGLLARHGGSSMVRAGDNRYHAILGNGGDALFVNPSSLAPVLIALGARLEIRGADGERELPLGEFYRSPSADGEREYQLAGDELLVAVRLPAAAGVNSATYEVRQREVLDWPLAAAAVALRMEGERVDRAVAVLGHVAPVPWPSPEAAQALEGKTITEQTAREAAQAALSAAQPLSRNAYKVRLAEVALKRAFLRAAGKEI